MRNLQLNDQGEDVRQLQQILIKIGYPLSDDGIFGKVTENTVKHFQQKTGISPDGVVGPNTWAMLQSYGQMTPPNHKFHEVVDEWLPLKPHEYMQDKTQKLGICYHHTVSDGNPASVVNTWNNDIRGAVGTHFIIGRQMLNGDTQHDGKIVQCIPLENWAHHILTTRMGFSSEHNNMVNKSYVGIEICSLGCLKLENGRFYTIDGRIQVPADQVVTLKTPFRTYQHWHKFTDKQIQAIINLTKALGKVLRLDLKKGAVPANDAWWEMSWDAMALRRVLTTHTNFEYGKFDTYPQKELKEAIEIIYS